MQRSIEIREDNLDQVADVINMSHQKHTSRINKLKKLIFKGVPEMDEQVEKALDSIDSSRSKEKTIEVPSSRLAKNIEDHII